MSELTRGEAGDWDFPSDVSTLDALSDVVDAVRVYATPVFNKFTTYDDAIRELEEGFPCLRDQKRLIVPLAYYANGDTERALFMFEKYAVANSQTAADVEYLDVAQSFCAAVKS